MTLKRATALAKSRGFRLVHGIVDSMWLKRPDATVEEFREVCEEMAREIELPLSFAGRYRWIVFLSSKVDPRVAVLNRYYGVYEDGTVKARGIELRRHDTPGIVRKCQADMLGVLVRARDSCEFRALIPEALRVLKRYDALVRSGGVPVEDLVIEKNLSKDLGEYSNLVPQAIAARRLAREGGRVHAGQRISFVLTRERAGVVEGGALPVELVEGNVVYDGEKYRELLISSAENLLLPFGYDRETLRKLLAGQELLL